MFYTAKDRHGLAVLSLQPCRSLIHNSQHLQTKTKTDRHGSAALPQKRAWRKFTDLLGVAVLQHPLHDTAAIWVGGQHEHVSHKRVHDELDLAAVNLHLRVVLK
jgi:hypothetical protein